MSTLLNGIHSIAPNFILLHSFWLKKLNSETPFDASSSKAREEIDQERDAYLRIDNYNKVGFATYTCLLLLLEERQHSFIETHFSLDQAPVFFGTKVGATLKGGFPSVISHGYKLELMLPLLAMLSRDSVQKPRFFNLLGFVCLERILLPYLQEEPIMLG